MEESRFREAMRLVPAAVAVITAGHEGKRNGLTATAFCSVSAAPPQILICVNRSASAEPLIAGTGHFVVNFLAERHDARARRFSTAKLDSDVRFSDIPWMAMCSGSPVMADAVVALDCAVARRMESGTHAIYLASVLDVRINEGPPLVYQDGAYRRIAG